MAEDERWKELGDKPITQKGMNEASASAHAFWVWPLKPDCHPDASLGVEYVSYWWRGAVKLWCSECQKPIAVLKVAAE